MVKKYTWSESVATGHAATDLQHKQFFAVLYEFGEDLEQNNGAKKLKKLLLFLKYYGEWHFGSEENAIACYHCPLAGKNIEQHKQYMVTIDGLLEQIRASGSSEELANAAYGALTDWLVNHIMKIDKANAEYANSSKVA